LSVKSNKSVSSQKSTKSATSQRSSKSATSQKSNRPGSQLSVKSNKSVTSKKSGKSRPASKISTVQETTGENDNIEEINDELLENNEDPPRTKCLGVLVGHQNYITCVAIFDAYVYTGSADSTVKKWDLTTNECLFTYDKNGHTSKIHKLLVSENLLFTTSNDKSAKVWHTNLEKNKDKPMIRTFKVIVEFRIFSTKLCEIIFATKNYCFRDIAMECTPSYTSLEVWMKVILNQTLKKMKTLKILNPKKKTLT